jgi:hypothetical protein
MERYCLTGQSANNNNNNNNNDNDDDNNNNNNNNLETKGYSADQGTGEMLILGWMLKKCVMKCKLGLSGSS